MQPEAIGEAREWLDRADLDLQLAERALRIPPALAGGAAYHVQQAAEKALKGFLAAHNAPFPHSHNLTVLLPLCQVLDASFVQFRYPGGPIEPTIADAEQGLRDATHLVSSVRQKLAL